MPPEPSVVEEVEALLRRGLDFYGKDFFAEAEACWRRALSLAPGERRAIEYLEAMGVDATPLPPSATMTPPPASASSLPPPSTERPASLLPAAVGLRILVADPSETQIRLVGALCRGAEVMGATSLRAAVEIGRATRPDLAFLACMLPGGGGARAIEAMRLVPGPVTTHFVLTAAPAEAPLVRPRLQALGASLYLKPFARDSLLRLLAQWQPGER